MTQDINLDNNSNSNQQIYLNETPPHINPLFDSSQNLYTVFTPNTDPELAKFCNNLEASLWQAGDINLSFDAEQWNTHMNKTEQDYIKQILAFFAASDGLVNENICLSYLNKVKIPEVKYFYYYQMMQEAVHSKTYSNLITTFITDTNEQRELFNSINNHPIIKKKADWCKKWMGNLNFNNDKDFFQSLIAFLAVEGIFFSSSFASIFWLRDRGILANSLGVANEYISRDEAQHASFASYLYNTFGRNPGSDQLENCEIYSIIKEAVEIEKEFVDYILPEKLSGMNKELMKQYVEFTADVWLNSLHLDKLYNVANPFPFMQTIGMNSKDNFFEKTRTNYSHKTDLVDNNNANKTVDSFSFDIDD